MFPKNHYSLFIACMSLLVCFGCNKKKPTQAEVSTTSNTNTKPNKPINIAPLDNSSNQSVFPKYVWKGCNPNSGDTVTYFLYAGTTNPPSTIFYSLRDTFCIPYFPLISYGTKYYWRILAKDNYGDSIFGDISCFTTRTCPWTEKAYIPTPRGYLASVYYNNKIYSIGGERYVTQTEYLGNVDCYDISANTWNSKGGLTPARSALVAEVIGNYIYAIGGRTATGQTNFVNRYNILTDTWDTLASIPTPRAEAASAVVNGVIYVMGGNGFPAVSTVEAYNPVSNTWCTKASMPIARSKFTAQVVNGKIYVMGGLSPFVCEYDPTLDSWSIKSGTPFYGNYMTSAVLNNIIYVTGNSDYNYAKYFQAYDPVTDTWCDKSYMLTERCGCNAVASTNRIYVIGGVNPNTWLGPTDEYNPALDP